MTNIGWITHYVIKLISPFLLRLSQQNRLIFISDSSKSFTTFLFVKLSFNILIAFHQYQHRIYNSLIYDGVCYQQSNNFHHTSFSIHIYFLQISHIKYHILLKKISTPTGNIKYSWIWIFNYIVIF